MRTSINTSVILDTNADVQLRINFNITMLDMSCEFATIDVYDVLGTNTQVSVKRWGMGIIITQVSYMLPHIILKTECLKKYREVAIG